MSRQIIENGYGASRKSYEAKRGSMVSSLIKKTLTRPSDAVSSSQNYRRNTLNGQAYNRGPRGDSHERRSINNLSSYSLSKNTRFQNHKVAFTSTPTESVDQDSVNDGFFISAVDISQTPTSPSYFRRQSASIVLKHSQAHSQQIFCP